MRRFLLGLLALAIGLAVGVPVALSTFAGSERSLAIGAHQATVRPAFDGYASLDFGPLLPEVRLPMDAPAGLGVHVRLGEAQVDSIEELVQQDAVIASQPQGEIAQVRAAVVDMASDAAVRGAGVAVVIALALAFGWWAVGPARRRRLLHDALHPTGRGLAAGTAGVVAFAGAIVLVTAPQRADAPERAWVPVRSVFPELPAEPTLERLEVSKGAITQGSRALVEGALYLYDDSVSFYGALQEQAGQVRVREPEEGERTALVVTDRHDNIGMDPVARTIADQAGAELLIDLGDDTSQGDAWEGFSVNSLADEFDGLDVVAVAGNHDSDTTVQQYEDAGFTVLDGEPVEVGGVRFLGESDPRGTTIAGYTESAEERNDMLAVQDEALADAACEADEAGERVGVLAVHSWGSAKKVAASGCVDLVLTGHLHYQVGPEAIEGEDGAITTRMTTGSTGGAVLPIALGSSLRREAQVTIVTFDEDGVPVGLQPVTFTPAGVIDVAEYVELPQVEGDETPTPSPSASATD